VCTCHKQDLWTEVSFFFSRSHWLTGVELEHLASSWSANTVGSCSCAADQVGYNIVKSLECFLDGVVRDATCLFGEEHVTFRIVNTMPSSDSGTHWVAIGIGFAFHEEATRPQVL
jgi:hypothetical protein